VVAIAAGGQQRVEAVERVGSAQMPPAAARLGLVVMVLLLAAPMLMGFRTGGGVAAGLLHAATVLLNGVNRRRGILLPEVGLVQLVLAVV